MTLAELNNVETWIQDIGRCINFIILKLEYQVQIVAFQILYFFTRCTGQAIHIKVLMINHKISVFWIIFNLSNVWSPLVLIFADMHYKNNDYNNFAENSGQVTIIINLITVAKFFEITCTGIFQHLLNAGSQENSLLGLISIYFGAVKTNNWGILYLYCLI